MCPCVSVSDVFLCVSVHMCVCVCVSVRFVSVCVSACVFVSVRDGDQILPE